MKHTITENTPLDIEKATHEITEGGPYVKVALSDEEIEALSNGKAVVASLYGGQYACVIAKK